MKYNDFIKKVNFNDFKDECFFKEKTNLIERNI